MMDLEAASSAQMALMDDLAPVAESIMPLMMDIDSLVMADDPFGINSALIADYFTVNDTQIDVGTSTRAILVSPFCVAESSILKFELAVNFGEGVEFNFFEETKVIFALRINDEGVAFAEFNDTDTPSSLSLRYQGRVDVDSEVFVDTSVRGDGVFIAAKELQWGYKIYGPEYNLIEEVNMDCLSDF